MGNTLSDVGVLNKAVSILDAVSGQPMALSELTDAVALPRATVHRLAVALERLGLLARGPDGRFGVGPRVSELARLDRRALVEAARPALSSLRDSTGESAQLYVRAQDRRVCLASLESPYGLRTIVPVGLSLPLDRGSAGGVLSGRMLGPGGWIESVEEREAGVASVSAPVVCGGETVAAVSVSGPLERTTRQPGLKYGAAVVEAAAAISRALS